MKEKPIFFIAILPSAELQKEVTALKQYIADTWGPARLEKPTAHHPVPAFRLVCGAPIYVAAMFEGICSEATLLLDNTGQLRRL